MQLFFIIWSYISRYYLQFVFIIIFHFLSYVSFAGTIRGVVLDTHLKPIHFATISVEHTSVGTSSDEKGNFILTNLPDTHFIILVSCVGFKDFKYVIDNISNQHHTIVLEKEDIQLSEVAICLQLHGNDVIEQSLSVQMLNKLFLDNTMPGSLMQGLSKIPGIASIDIGTGLSKPVIRGLSFNRVVVASNHIKIEAQQWGESHGLEIDRFDVENIQIIKGPASLLFGSDAIGGVINLLPAPIIAPNSHEGEIVTLFNSSNNTYGASLGYKERRDKYYCNVRLTYVDFADQKVGITTANYNSYDIELNKNIRNTAGSNIGTKLGIGKFINKGNTYFEGSNYYQKNACFSDVQGLELRASNINHDNSKRDVNLPYQTSNHLKISNHTNLNLADYKITSNIAYQSNIHTDYVELTDITGKSIDLPKDNISTKLIINTLSDNIFIKKNIGASCITLGKSAEFINNNISGFNFIIPAYTKLAIGGYIYVRSNIGYDVFINYGVRYDWGYIEMEQYTNPRYTVQEDSLLASSFSRKFDNISGILGISKSFFNNTVLKANLGKSFRIPTSMELSANGMVNNSFRFEKGDASLNPEEAYQIDISLEYDNKISTINFSPFYSYFSNFIYLNPSGNFNNVTGAGQIYEYKQTQSVRCGFELMGTYIINNYFEIDAGLDYLRAINLENNYPLPFTPPLTAIGGLNLSLPNIHKRISNYVININVNYKSAQNQVVQNELKTPESLNFDISANLTFHTKKYSPKIKACVENIFNHIYFNHLSIYRRLGIPEAGRHLKINIVIPF